MCKRICKVDEDARVWQLRFWVSRPLQANHLNGNGKKESTNSQKYSDKILENLFLFLQDFIKRL